MPIPAYRLTPDEMTEAAAMIGCKLTYPHIGRGWLWEPDPDVVLVTNNSTETRWWQDAAAGATAVCLIRGRLHWKSTLQGQTALYFGLGVEAFRVVFSRFGVILYASAVPVSCHLPRAA
jgi:hypothetical protein